MQLINPAIIYGLGLAAVPVVLHMLLRARPKPHLFPALRLLQARRRHNRRRLRLRHIGAGGGPAEVAGGGLLAAVAW